MSRGFPKHPEHCSSKFTLFRQSKSRELIDLVLLQETRVTFGESNTMEKTLQLLLGFRAQAWMLVVDRVRALSRWSDNVIEPLLIRLGNVSVV